MPILYDDHDEEVAHLSAIESLAEELDRPAAKVKTAYETELARLKAGARVKDYLIIFASRRTREALRKS